MRVEVILDSGYIEVKAWVEIDQEEFYIEKLRYDGQAVDIDKLNPELEREIEYIANEEWEARGE